ncbi:3'-5' exonuclease [Capnocytophaga periodontitidis]|uniref:3'-5' exonuclease n=1 Tax=Capnocytophaga periodontitidis TaxID=2795027 RepID=UPI0018E11DF4|nr:3'-5' exonuclease [Capnocytophaga periodontitidis]MBI1669301.1 3'-5' exonuclease [Capnocytophaga periodontitidis]
MLHKLNLDDILFLDIETVPLHQQYSELSAEAQMLWEEKTRYQRKEEFSAEEFYDRAGIWAEFGKIVCISVGYFSFRHQQRTFRVTSFTGEEKNLLEDFSRLVNEHFSRPNKLFCAHNGKEFDFPYISRRMIINGIEIPQKLQLFGKKPWEIPHLDTMEMWKFGDYKHYTSLKLLAHILGIPSPKDDIDGCEVRNVFYNEGDIDRIATYCEKDTITVAQILLRFRNDTLLNDDEILILGH